MQKLNDISRGKNVKSIGISKKETNGIKTDEIVVSFDVEKKKPLYELSSDEIVPDEVEIDGIVYKTDVKEIGEVRALSCYLEGDSEIERLRGNPSFLTPMKGGQEIIQFPTGWSEASGGGYFRTVGTLGFLAVDSIDNLVVGVTNTHVPVDKILNISERAVTDEGEPYNTIEPQEWIVDNQNYNPRAAVNDGGTLITDGAVRIKRHIPFTLSGPNYVDGCLLIMNPTHISSDSYQVRQPTTEPNYTAHLPFATTSEIDSLLADDPTIYSTGRTTGPKGWGSTNDCKLTITGYVATVNVSYGDDEVPFSDVFTFQFRDGSENPIAGGDSGSAVIAVIGGVRKIVGLAFAGGSNTAFVCRIDRIADELNIIEWNNSYVFNSTVPTHSIVVLSKDDPSADSTTLTDSTGDLVYQMGMTTNTGYTQFS